jgi:hypothetical protein
MECYEFSRTMKRSGQGMTHIPNYDANNDAFRAKTTI